MPRPIPLKKILKTLRSRNFFLVAQRGSHAKYRKVGTPTRNVTVKTTKKEIPYGTFRSILLQSGLKEEDFNKKK
ncbi:type II toxin-antitoxin system HicA family toxin [Patescibacteria group bacterium]|nr:type II toxin-antitoxin system HicA family toxin [Patescibacteria group bacterium]MBU1200525.1 type II toxin-antitoxin system HicA family toxin [Patescibacteria group bacterium]MBU1256454.1 type II toxin-antitoxin system HicA family toxin [Patescibacteria group bacterium]MBU1457399.1 type II toxin-antitoxin system HicA family toxin [Patescibacteria group bacterium]